MQTVGIILVLVGLAAAIPIHEFRHETIPVVQRTEVRDTAGQFALSYLSGDGTTYEEHGALKPNNDGTDSVLVKKGSFSYTSPEGIPISVTFVADEYGFRPEGAHLPVAPTVPEIFF